MNLHTVKNIFEDIPANIPHEIFETIFHNNQLHFERIISKGHTTPAGKWYDQEKSEWVILLKGSATLLFEDNLQKVDLAAGDYILIPARTKHRVEYTDSANESIWLTLHF